MSDQTWQIISMVIYLIGMIYIGYWAYRRTAGLGDYMLGGRGLGPAVTALSAGAADMSGWLLMGLPGAIYKTGLVEAWIAVGLTIGAWLNWKLVAPRLRAYTKVASDSITIPSFLENRLRDRSRLLRVASGIIILVFFTFYVSSGMVASGVFMEKSFGMEYHLGMLLIVAVTVGYTLFGGFLAVSYTDFVQGLMMFLALIAVPLLGLFAVGGPSGAMDSIRAANPDALSMVKGATAVGVISSLAWGLGYFGQPHIIVRFMAIRTVEETKQGRRIGIGWMVLSCLGAIATAMIGLAYFQQHPAGKITNPETVYIAMGQILFHPIIAGFMLAAVLAAIMSTISSQLLVTSSALVEDLYKIIARREGSDSSYVLLGRLGVLAISVIAAALAWTTDSPILKLVAFAWAGFGAAFGPTILMALFWRKLTSQGAIAGMVTGAILVGIWGTRDGGIFDLYEILPGFVGNLLVATVVSLLTHRHDEEIHGEFEETLRQVRRDERAAAAEA
ncbi:sodium/proline symporter PutP [Arsenicicoccus sp. oral taxon 190]|uniref:sodium/proline symporter PutP n=1 Tax=Arsenicicoccus sp. oral taxon 190 TaxID=1658671 RepID=UPI000679F545|nr:sodium/proline symporter PutP [Arsenicicoccus sp. oral taxon 190]AKT52328.1 proline:sodium symporter PutP [Arsenicicoccus sp. oral taxon 190]